MGRPCDEELQVKLRGKPNQTEKLAFSKLELAWRGKCKGSVMLSIVFPYFTGYSGKCYLHNQK